MSILQNRRMTKDPDNFSINIHEVNAILLIFQLLAPT